MRLLGVQGDLILVRRDLKIDHRLNSNVGSEWKGTSVTACVGNGRLAQGTSLQWSQCGRKETVNQTAELIYHHSASPQFPQILMNGY